MSELTYEQASAIVSAVLEAGHRYELNPLTVAVLDAGGHLVAFEREDGVPKMRFQYLSRARTPMLAPGTDEGT